MTGQNSTRGIQNKMRVKKEIENFKNIVKISKIKQEFKRKARIPKIEDQESQKMEGIQRKQVKGRRMNSP